jgi:hypothetical protein
MADPHVISALRAKRAEVAGLIFALERQIAQCRADLIHLDAVLRLYQPERDPTEIRPKRSVHRNRYFAQGELARLCLEEFRVSPEPMPLNDIVAAVIAAKGFDAGDRVLQTAIGELVKATLAPMRQRGTVEKLGQRGGARWKLAEREQASLDDNLPGIMMAG